MTVLDDCEALKTFEEIYECTNREGQAVLNLRVVQTQAILFLKSMSERYGSDIQRLSNLIARSTQNQSKMASFKFRIVVCRIRFFPTLILKN